MPIFYDNYEIKYGILMSIVRVKIFVERQSQGEQMRTTICGMFEIK
jgi:hypothetical protein